MDKEWVDKKIRAAEDIFSKIEEIFREQEIIPSDFVDKILNKIKSKNEYFCFDLDVGFAYLDSVYTDGDFSVEKEKAWRDWIKDNDIENLIYTYTNRNSFIRYLDSEPMEFDGDIIITDPCYIMKELDESDRPKWSDYHPYSSIREYPDYDEKTKTSKMFNLNAKKLNEADRLWDNAHPCDWVLCNYGDNMEVLGINTYMTRDTLYGDWSCTIFNSDTREPIGEFCADGGLVSVFLLDEVLKYNPNFDYHIEKPWTTTLIKNFKGTVQFVVKCREGIYKDTTTYHKKGEKWENFSVVVVGHGINKITGEHINFVGR